VYVSESRNRIDWPGFTGAKYDTTISVSGVTGSPMSIFFAVISAPLSVSCFSSSPVSRMSADGFDDRLPVRTTLMYLSTPGRDSV
jgi:hypothetical protein